MDKQAIKEMMAIVRPAIVAMYGRQALTLINYREGMVYANTVRRWYLQVQGRSYVYKVEVEDGRVINLNVASVVRTVGAPELAEVLPQLLGGGERVLGPGR